MCGEHSTVRGILENLPSGDLVAGLDMGASPEPFARGTPRAASAMVIVAEPYYKALEAAVRLVGLARELDIPRIGLLANKVRDDDQRAAMEQVCGNNGIELWGVIPYDDLFARADVKGISPLDLDGQGSPALAELSRFAATIVPQSGI